MYTLYGHHVYSLQCWDFVALKLPKWQIKFSLFGGHVCKQRANSSQTCTYHVCKQHANSSQTCTYHVCKHFDNELLH